MAVVPVRVLAVTIGLLFVAQFAAVFVVPPSEERFAEADAVVVLSGDHGDRLELGLRLVRSGTAPTLVILNPGDGPAARSRPLCEEPQPFEVDCPTPPLVSTIGDVRQVQALADERGWRRVVVVTSRFHVARSRVVLARCSDVDVEVRGSRVDLPARVWARAVAHEIAGIGQALLLPEC